MSNESLQSTQNNTEPARQSLEQKPSKSDKDTVAEIYEKIIQQQKEIAKHKKEIDVLLGLICFGFIVLLIMVAGMLIQSWHERTVSYNDLLKQVYSLQNKFELQNCETKLSYSDLLKQVSSLQNQLQLQECENDYDN